MVPDLFHPYISGANTFSTERNAFRHQGRARHCSSVTA